MTSPLKSSLFTDKPVSLSVKDYLIRKLAVKMMVSENVIDAVVAHQFRGANEALSRCKSLEISGFGKILFNEGKANKMMAKWLSQKALFEKMAADESLSEVKRRSAAMKLEGALNNIRDLKPKMYGSVPDLRGLEEQFVPSKRNESSH